MFKYVSTPLYEALANDKYVSCNCTAATTKFVLPSLPNGGEDITIKKTDSSANVITVYPAKGQTLDNATLQVETATVIGAITTSGNATIVITSTDMAAQTLTVSVPVLDGDAIAITGRKIRNVLNGLKAVTNAFTVSGGDANIVLTQIQPSGNDTTLNISIDNGTCTGLTTASTSTSTTAGVAVTISTQDAYSTFANNEKGWALIDAYSNTSTSQGLTTPEINEAVSCTATSTQLNLAGTKATYASRLMYLGVPELDDVDQVTTTVNMKVGTYTIAASPDVPRVLTVSHTQVGGTTDTLGTIAFVGTDSAGAALTETITPLDGTIATGAKAFKTVTSATGAGWVIDSTEDTITIGTGPALGLPEKIVASTTNTIALLAGVTEAISAVGTGADIPNSTITITSALGGTAVHVLTYGA